MAKPFERLTIEDVARYPRPGATVPGQLGFTPDGKDVTFLYSETGTLVRELWAYDVATGEPRRLAGAPPESADEGLLSLEEGLRRERARLRELGITRYEFARDADPRVLLVPLGGRLYVARGDEPLGELEGTEGALDARLSRDGKQVAFVRQDELFVMAVNGGGARRLTEGAEPGLTHGLAEFIAQEELDRDEGYWWSPDGRRIAFERADSRHIPVYRIVHQGNDALGIEEHRYPFAGAANAFVELGVVDVESGETRCMDLGPERDIYLARVAWTPGGKLAALVLARDQRSMRWLLFGDDGKATPLMEEQGDPWLNLDHDMRFLESCEVLRSSERSGFRHLYLHRGDGALVRHLTEGDWMVTRLLEVDETRRVAYFQATRDGVLERHVYSVALDGGAVRRLTDSPGWHDGVVARDCSRFLDIASNLEHAPTVTLRAMDGRKERVLFANEGCGAAELGLRPPRLVEVPAAAGTLLYGAVYEPPALKPGDRYPVIVSVYGGPHAQSVAGQWGLTVDLRAQYLAQEGFIVFKLDNRGSANRGLAFEAALARRMGTVEVEDQVAGVRWLAGLPHADTSRTGIYGWSYGGYITCLALMRAPEVFKVGVAGAPVTHYDGYDTGYTERYMGTPQENPDGYRDGSVMAHVDELEGKLLLVHGMVDENVHFRHTARLAVALAAAQKDYDLLIFPVERHMPRDAKGLEYQERRLVEYFKAHL